MIDKNKLKEVLFKDFKELLKKEFTTDWKSQRLMIEVYLNIMNLDNTMKYLNNLTICGNKIENVIKILNGLELEKKTNIEMTMDNINEYIKLFDKETQKIQNRIINEILNEEGNDDD